MAQLQNKMDDQFWVDAGVETSGLRGTYLPLEIHNFARVWPKIRQPGGNILKLGPTLHFFLNQKKKKKTKKMTDRSLKKQNLWFFCLNILFWL